MEEGAADASTKTLSVLLVEDDPDFAALLEVELELANHHVQVLSSMHDALGRLEDAEHGLDVIVLDLGLPDISGAEGLRAAFDSTTVPIVVYTGDGREETRRQAAEIGAAAFLVKGSTSPTELIEVCHRAVAERRELAVVAEPHGVVPFDGPAEFIGAALAHLAAVTDLPAWVFARDVKGTDIVVAVHHTGGRVEVGDRPAWSPPVAEALDRGRIERIDGGPLAGDSHGGTVVVATLRVDAQRHGVLIGWTLPEQFAGFNSLAPATFVARQLATLHAMEHERARETRRAAIADNAASADLLTGIGNRRAFKQFIQTEDARSRRYGTPASVFIVDLDELKRINDADGHAAGDRHIRAAADAMRHAVRDSDAVFRIGGDEFAVVAVECDATDAAVLDARLREHLADAGVLASIGWAGRPPEPTLELAADLADERMYREKQERRAAQ